MFDASESPMSAVAMRVASTSSTLPPTPLTIVRSSDCAGKMKLAWRVKSPVIC